jgi:mycothiol system anti-sigma-R factor
MQDCQAIARIMHAYLDGELSAKETVDVQTHLDNCPECAVLYRNEKLFLDLIKKSLPYAVAPPGLKHRVMQSLKAGSHEKRFVKWLRPMTIPLLVSAVLVVVFIVVNGFLPENKTVPELVDLAVHSHQERLNDNIPLDIRSSDPVHVARWFEKRVDFPVSFAQEPVKNLRLLGGRLLEFQGGKAIFLSYEMGQHRLSLVMTPPQAGDLFRGQEFTFKQMKFYQSTYHGFQTLSWTQEGLAYVVVSDRQELNKQACLICHGSDNQREVIRGFAEKGI